MARYTLRERAHRHRLGPDNKRRIAYVEFSPQILELRRRDRRSAALAGTASAETTWQKNHPRRTQVNHRLANQNRRIHNDVKDGTMTKGQAAKLHHEDHQVRQEERDMASQNGGHITKARTGRPEPSRKRHQQSDPAEIKRPLIGVLPRQACRTGRPGWRRRRSGGSVTARLLGDLQLQLRSFDQRGGLSSASGTAAQTPTLTLT